MIWNTRPTVEGLNHSNQNTMMEHLDIQYIAVDDDSITATMPVDHRTHQPFGLLHGGASVTLAETLGSVASWLCLDDPNKKAAVGLEINANHLRPARTGFVTGIVKPIKLGRRIHVWEIKISDSNNKLVCVSRLTVAIVDNVN